ncbi:MAG: hypothetical protein JWM50_355 [Microbacteriaceae bacterium]|nr:hypothetical protein [Microbacteriaceae bacterium]
MPTRLPRPPTKRLRVAAILGTVLLAGLTVGQGINPPAAQAAGALACDQNTLFGISSTGQLASIDATTGKVTNVASISPGNNGLGVARNGVAAYAFDNGANSITGYDALTAAISTTNTVDPSGNQTVLRGAINPATGLYYYAGGGATAYMGAFDPVGPTKIGHVGNITNLASGNGDFAFSSRGLLFVVGANEIRRVDNTTVPTTAGSQTLATSLVATLPTGTDSPGIAFSADGYLFVANGSNVLKLDPASGAVLATVALSGGFSASDLGSCNYANTLSAQTNVPTRWQSGDQFALAVTGGGITSGNTASTSGSTSGLQPQMAGAALTVPTKRYTATQTAAGTTDLDNYSTTYACTNVNNSDTVASGSGNTASFTFPAATSADGTDVVCTFSNAAIIVPTAAVNDTATTSPGSTVTKNATDGVLSNDTGTGLTVTANTQPSHGTVTMNPNGSYVYTPAAGFSGTDTFTYTVTASSNASSTATVAITVMPGAVNDIATTTANTPLAVTAPGTLANDSGTGLTVTGHTNPTHGGLVINADGSYIYTPTNGFSGTDTFTYTTTDSSGNTATGTVTLRITPVAVNNTGTTPANTPLTVATPGVIGNDVGTGLTITAHTNPDHGTVAVNANGSYTYTPTTGYSGPDSFDYTTTDNAGSPATARVTITVTPVASDDIENTPAGVAVTVAAPGLLVNDIGTGITVTGNTRPANGIVLVNANGSYTYTPAPGYSGVDAFDYTITDSHNTSSTATVTVTVGAVAANDAASTAAGTDVRRTAANGVLSNDTGTGLAVTAHTAPSTGTVTVKSDGSYEYTPALGFSGTDTFTYTTTDSTGDQAAGTVTITVNPRALNDIAITSSSTPLRVTAPGVLGNDVGSGLTVTENTAPEHGTAAIHANGSYIYTPTPGYSGPDSLTYRVTDSTGNSSTATVELTVNPIAVNNMVNTTSGAAVTVKVPGVLANDLGAGLAVTSHTNPSHGSVTIDQDGSFTYTPMPGYSGADTFTYTITDSSGGTATATVTVTVGAVAVDDSGTTPAGSPLTVHSVNGLLANDRGVGLTVTGNSQPTDGTVVIDSDGSYVYTPHAGFDGSDTFTYTAADSAGNTSTATVTITVTPVEAAIARPDTKTGTTGEPATIDPLTTDDPTEGYSFDPSSIALIDPVAGNLTLKVTVSTVGVWTIVEGSVVFTPAAGFEGSAAIGYRITDTSGAVASSTITVTYPTIAVTAAPAVPAVTAVLAHTGSDLPVIPLSISALVALFTGFLLIRRRRA